MNDRLVTNDAGDGAIAVLTENSNMEKRSLVLSIPNEDAEVIAATVERSFASRLAGSPNLTAQEASEITCLDRRLFAGRLELSEQSTNLFRVLAVHSQTRLQLPHELKSHRKFIGPLIVALKRALFPLLNFFFRGLLQSMEQFNRYTVKTLADQQVALERLTSGQR